ncbi:MAG: hypothetical protein K6B41_07485 [Butyrivibrio sp.]|nr:hypothetical protein [Butyrivibrio sp.]
MPYGRKILVEPIITSDKIFVEKWLNEKISNPMEFDNETEFYSNKGVRVRSKSELIIANMLEQYNVPYKYERPLLLKKWGQVRPDFTCLNVVQRKELIWEHFGMMDSPSYANKNIVKMANYQQNGFFVGKNMITTFETSVCPISSLNVKKMIEHYLIQ